MPQSSDKATERPRNSITRLISPEFPARSTVTTVLMGALYLSYSWIGDEFQM